MTDFSPVPGEDVAWARNLGSALPVTREQFKRIQALVTKYGVPHMKTALRTRGYDTFNLVPIAERDKLLDAITAQLETHSQPGGQ